MRRACSHPVALFVTWLTLTPTARAAGDAWAFDVLHLTNGAHFCGVIDGETPGVIRFRHVRRAPGRPTIVLATTFTRAEVARVERVDEAARARTRERLAELDPTGVRERRHAGGLQLKRADWPGKPGGAWRYDSERFSLTSDAAEGVVRRAVVRLEQVFAAFGRFLPARAGAGRPLVITLHATAAGYREAARAAGGDFGNPAYYDATAHSIVCGSELETLGRELESARDTHLKMRDELSRREVELRRLYQGAELVRHLHGLAGVRERLDTADRRNDAVFESSARRLLTLVQHEAFHAYAATSGVRLPRWLDEGLAQIFEGAMVEAGELRVGQPEAQRLRKLRAAMESGDLPPLAEVLRAGGAAFGVPASAGRVRHIDERAVAEGAYLGSWALAFWVTFELRLPGTARFDSYTKALTANEDPVRAFEVLTGRSLADCEREWRRYLAALRSDGGAG